MTTVNPTSSSMSYDPTYNSYSNDLALLADSGLSTGSTATPAFTLDSSLTSSDPTVAASAATQTSQSGFNPAAYSLPPAFTNPNLLSQLTPVEISYLMGLPTTESASGATSAQPTSEATQTDLYASNPAGTNPLGDPLTWQIGDSTLYQMDPSLLSALNGPASSDVSSTYSPSQSATPVGTSVNTSA